MCKDGAQVNIACQLAYIQSTLTFVGQHQNMKKAIFFCLVVLLIAVEGYGQRNYTSLQGEYIFSISNYSGALASGNPRLRFTRFPNFEIVHNIDSKGLLGMYFGLSSRNIGINWKDSVRHKRRAQSIGVPLVFKIGDLENNNFFFLGGEAEYFFHFKKKDWINDEKVKSSEWLSDELNGFQPSLMVGFCAKRIMIKAKYYLNDFFSDAYQGSINDLIFYPPQPSKIFYLSLAVRTELGNKKSKDEKPEVPKGEGLDIGSLNLDQLYRDL